MSLILVLLYSLLHVFVFKLSVLHGLPLKSPQISSIFFENCYSYRLIKSSQFFPNLNIKKRGSPD